MAITPEQADRSFDEIDRVQARARARVFYQYISWLFFIWGALMLLSRAALYLDPGPRRIFGTAWPLIGIALSLVWAGGMRTRWTGERRRQGRLFVWRYGATTAAGALFVLAVAMVLAPLDPLRISVVILLVVAFILVLIGIHNGMRICVPGLFLGVLSVAAYFHAADFNLWVGVGGGISWVLAGLWMRRA